MTSPYPDPTRRALITVSALAAVMMTTLDGTIAVIALPRIQSSLAASQEQIAWVLTSYLIAAAIATPLAGWLADRYGRRRVMAASVLGFTLSSVGCGMSPSLEALVVFRFLQGAAGASLVPLSQVLLLDINPPERHGPAIAMFGIGTLVGPMIGPTLGGWLTESFSWRWIFLINAPVGVLAFLGLVLFLRNKQRQDVARFDIKGFVMVSVTLASLQLMFDRGQLLDWFSSREVCIEAAVAATGFYLSAVHMFTARDPFIKPAIFKDRNFSLGCVLGAMIGVFLIGVVPIVTSLMQQLLGYPVMLTGILSAPRAVGNIVTVLVVGRIVGHMDPRILIAIGLILQIASLYMLTQLSLDISQNAMAVVAFLQGCGSGFLFLPLTLLVFSTLPHQYRNEGSTLFALTRSLGGAVGISVIEAMTIRDSAQVQSRLVEHVRPDSPILALRLPELDLNLPLSAAGMMGQVLRQATMVAYVDTFRLLFILAVAMVPMCLMMTVRKAQPGEVQAPPVIHAD